MDMVTQHNIAAIVSPRLAAAFAAIVAGSGADNAPVTGVTLDRVALKLPRNAEICIPFTAVLAAAATLTIKNVKVQDSADGTTFADYLAFADPGVVATGAGTVNGQVNLPASLNGARQYVRVLLTPDLSAANTDTVAIGAIAVLAGFDRLPAA